MRLIFWDCGVSLMELVLDVSFIVNFEFFCSLYMSQSMYIWIGHKYTFLGLGFSAISFVLIKVLGWFGSNIHGLIIYVD